MDDVLAATDEQLVLEREHPGDRLVQWRRPRRDPAVDGKCGDPAVAESHV